VRYAAHEARTREVANEFPCRECFGVVSLARPPNRSGKSRDPHIVWENPELFLKQDVGLEQRHDHREKRVQIRIGYELVYQCAQATPMLLMLNVHPSRALDLLVPDKLVTDPVIPISRYRDGFGNWCNRFVAPIGQLRLSANGIVTDTGEPDVVATEARQCVVEDLPDEVLVFLLPSRYGETEKLSDIAWSLFGKTSPGWGRVQAICDYVQNHISFGYEHANATRTAWEAHRDHAGVCRDFAHLAIAFCRCMNIPARYCTGYLGDIGVPASDLAMDFSAWFEAYLDDAWYTFDARHNVPRIGRVLIARGRDAADVAISTAFGANRLSSFSVRTEEAAAA
jgi:transglutaminase-like putative cysteine protease